MDWSEMRTHSSRSILSSLGQDLASACPANRFNNSLDLKSTYNEAGVGEEGETGTLESDQLGTVVGQADDCLVSQLAAGGDTEITDIGATLQQGHHALVLDVPTSLQVDCLKAVAVSG